MAKILFVEDSIETQVVLKTLLREHTLVVASTFGAALPLLEENRFNLILVDIELPDRGGLELFDFFARKNKGVPVIVVTAHSDFGSKAAAFFLGADDFLVKPFDSSDLKLRVESYLRRQEANRWVERIHVGKIFCDVGDRVLEHEDGHLFIQLTEIEFKIFFRLASQLAKVTSRDDLAKLISKKNADRINSRALDTHISNLRRKLIGTGLLIETVIGQGHALSEIK